MATAQVTGREASFVVRAPSTWGVNTSCGISLQSICGAAGWASSHTSVKHYHPDVTVSTAVRAVLEVGSSGLIDTA